MYTNTYTHAYTQYMHTPILMRLPIFRLICNFPEFDVYPTHLLLPGENNRDWIQTCQHTHPSSHPLLTSSDPSCLQDAEERGVLKPGGVIVEGTAGNTGIGLTLVANARGYKTVIVIPKTQSQVSATSAVNQLHVSIQSAPRQRHSCAIIGLQ